LVRISPNADNARNFYSVWLCYWWETIVVRIHFHISKVKSIG
jgi:hypothetical protein